MKVPKPGPIMNLLELILPYKKSKNIEMGLQNLGNENILSQSLAKQSGGLEKDLSNYHVNSERVQ